MKTAGVILSLLIILLNGIPCCWDTCSEGPEVDPVESHTENQTSCSPFMGCGSCTGFVLFEDEEELPALNPQTRKKMISLTTAVSSEFLDLIWQPPRNA